MGEGEGKVVRVVADYDNFVGYAVCDESVPDGHEIPIELWTAYDQAIGLVCSVISLIEEYIDANKPS